MNVCGITVALSCGNASPEKVDLIGCIIAVISTQGLFRDGHKKKTGPDYSGLLQIFYLYLSPVFLYYHSYYRSLQPALWLFASTMTTVNGKFMSCGDSFSLTYT